MSVVDKKMQLEFSEKVKNYVCERGEEALVGT